MRYLVTIKADPPFLTRWFDPDNHFNSDSGMVVFDLMYHKYTDDGKIWKKIELDQL